MYICRTDPLALQARIIIPSPLIPANWTDRSNYGSTESTILWAVSLQYPLYVILVGRAKGVTLCKLNREIEITLTGCRPGLINQ